MVETHLAAIEVHKDDLGGRRSSHRAQERRRAADEVWSRAVAQERARLVGRHEVLRQQRYENRRGLKRRDQRLESTRAAVEAVRVLRVKQHSLVGEYAGEQVRRFGRLPPERAEERRERRREP